MKQLGLGLGLILAPVAHAESPDHWFRSQIVSPSWLSALPERERAMRLNAGVYRFCRDGAPPSDPDSLYSHCVGQCGDRAYVLRGVLGEVGIETRFANLHNIPIQGNHTVVEAFVDGDWMVLDPTFGSTFDDSLIDVAYDDRPPQPTQALTSFDWRQTPLATLYSGRFNHHNMTREAYQQAEAIGYGDPQETVMLSIPMDLAHGSDELMASGNSLATLAQSWLAETNLILNDNDPNNDVSFNTSLFSTSSGRRSTIIELENLEVGSTYEVTVQLFSSMDDGRVQVGSVGRGARIDRAESFDLVRGVATYSFNLTAQREHAALFARSASGPTWNLRLFGVRVEEAG